MPHPTRARGETAGRLLIAALLALFAASLLKSPGTPDVQTWMLWIDNIDQYGLVSGYAANERDYPPLSCVILWSVHQLASWFDADPFLIFKISLLAFLLLTSVIFLWWTRDFTASVILCLSLVLNSVALAYLDIYFAPTFIASMWALQGKRYRIFGALFALTCLIKWQPLIGLPFIVIHALFASEGVADREKHYRDTIRDICLPAALVVGVVLAAFGAETILSLKRALSHTFLSGNALNLSWILTYLLQSLDPETYGGLEDGLIRWMHVRDLRITVVPKILFALGYLAVLFAFLRSRKGFDDLLFFSVLGYLTYFVLNTGVHENHLFVANLLVLMVFSRGRAHRWVVITIVLMNNINLFLFYGVDGSGLAFSRFIGVDVSLLLAAYNLMFFALLLKQGFSLGRLAAIEKTAPHGRTAR